MNRVSTEASDVDYTLVQFRMIFESSKTIKELMSHVDLHTAKKALMDTLSELNLPIDQALSKLQYCRGR